MIFPPPIPTGPNALPLIIWVVATVIWVGLAINALRDRSK